MKKIFFSIVTIILTVTMLGCNNGKTVLFGAPGTYKEIHVFHTPEESLEDSHSANFLSSQKYFYIEGVQKATVRFQTTSESLLEEKLKIEDGHILCPSFEQYEVEYATFHFVLEDESLFVTYNPE